MQPWKQRKNNTPHPIFFVTAYTVSLRQPPDRVSERSGPLCERLGPPFRWSRAYADTQSSYTQCRLILAAPLRKNRAIYHKKLKESRENTWKRRKTRDMAKKEGDGALSLPERPRTRMHQVDEIASGWNLATSAFRRHGGAK